MPPKYKRILLKLSGEALMGGRRTGIIAGTYHRALGPATLSVNGGFIAAMVRVVTSIEW